MPAPATSSCEEVNVSELVQRSVETGFGHMVTQGPGRPPGVQIDPAVRSWRVGVDKRRFERVMVNLMENADHYGGGATAIAVGPGAGTAVEVTVDDDGPGIDPLERLKIFERFYRGSASGRRGTGTGTGLGLALVDEHMRVMHGSVRVESSPRAAAPASSSLCRCSTTGTGRRTASEAPARDPVRPRLGNPRRRLRHPHPGQPEHDVGVEGPLPPARPPYAHDDDHGAETNVATYPSRSSSSTRARTTRSRRRQRVVAAPAPLTTIITSLLSGPTQADTAKGLSTAIPGNVTVLSTTTQGNIVTVNMNAAFGAITGISIELAVSQIVATVASENGFNTGVLFEIDGQRTSVPIVNGSQVTDPVYLIEFLNIAP